MDRIAVLLQALRHAIEEPVDQAVPPSPTTATAEGRGREALPGHGQRRGVIVGQRLGALPHAGV